MNNALPKLLIKNIDDFHIEPNTKMVLRITEKRTKLYQQVRMQRKSDHIVTVTLREYGGAIFKVRVSLLDEDAVLFCPDFSRLPEADVFTFQVVKKICTILETRRSTSELTIVRTHITA